jgi:hypothetical protein
LLGAGEGNKYVAELLGAVADPKSLDLDAYVTNHALDGLFRKIAEQERLIRKNPVARTTDLLKQVFGAIKR